MTKLTDAQLVVLSKAAALEHGAAILPEKMPKAAAMKVGASLVAKKLMREVRAKGDMPIWREDADGRRFSLILTRAGRDAIGIEESVGGNEGRGESASTICRSEAVDGERGVPEMAVKCSKIETATDAANKARGDVSSSAIVDATVDDVGIAEQRCRRQTSKAPPRAGSKQALVIDLLSKDEGATIDQLITATGWLPHTTRAALTGLRKRGFEIERASSKGGASIYRIVKASIAA
jgi:hypothetical protein